MRTTGDWNPQQRRPVTLGCKTWLFAGSAWAAEGPQSYSLIRSAKLNGLEPILAKVWVAPLGNVRTAVDAFGDADEGALDRNQRVALPD